MMSKKSSAYLIVLGVLSSGLLFASQPADAASGSVSVDPGETKYVSFGSCAVSDVLLWNLDIDTWSTIFEYWLQAPDGTHLSMYSLTWGTIVGMAGEWKLGFHIDESGWWGATVYYTIYCRTPYVEILGPSNSSYTNHAEFMAWGHIDDFADELSISLDGVHYDPVDFYSGVWNAPVSLSNDGTYFMVVEAVMTWGSYSVKYYDTVSFKLDRVLPELRIVSPSSQSCVGCHFSIEWQCSDNNGIRSMYVRVDLQEWVSVEEERYDCSVSEGGHIIDVRVSDLASNGVNASITVTSDSTSPVVTLKSPAADSKISEDTVTISWTGSDELSGIDHYEVKIGDGDWIDVGMATSYKFTDLQDEWYTVTVRAIDKSGNTEESAVSFGVYTSIWSANGPYDGIPLYALIAAIIVAAIASILLFRKRRGGAEVSTATEETAPEPPPEGISESE